MHMKIRKASCFMLLSLWVLLHLIAFRECYAGTVNYSYDGAGRLVKAEYVSAAVITYSYDAAGNLLSRVIALPAPAMEQEVAVGWNLLCLWKEPKDKSVESVLGEAKSSILSVWKWEGNTWAVYLPGGGTDSYAGSKGFNVLKEIGAGEGFWVNAESAKTLTINGADPSGTGLALVKGWNLVGLKGSDKTSVTDLIAGEADKIVSIWKWVDNKWAVYLPGGETDSYTTGKGFKVLSEIDTGEGIWINCSSELSLE